MGKWQLLLQVVLVPISKAKTCHKPSAISSRTPIQHATIITIAKTIYYFGGYYRDKIAKRRAQYIQSRKSFKYDMENNTWASIVDMKYTMPKMKLFQISEEDILFCGRCVCLLQ